MRELKDSGFYTGSSKDATSGLRGLGGAVALPPSTEGGHGCLEANRRVYKERTKSVPQTVVLTADLNARLIL